jgi:hypothetical protein
VAIERSGAPTEYARTLLHVAERYAAGEPTAALAFGDRREPSGLAERIQRLLSPNHRPHLRLTWRAMAGSLLAGCGLLVLMAVGTRITVEAILTPQERMDRIEKVLVENGQAADADVLPADDNSASENLTFSGRVRTEDGGPLPKYLWINQHLQGAGNASYGTSVLKDKDDTFKGACRQGRLTLSMEAPGYAPCIVGPLKMQGTNPVTGIELVLRRGFAVALQMVDADSGAPLAEAPVAAVFISPNNNIAGRQLTTDLQGRAVMTNCASLPMEVTGNADGYEIIQQTFAALTPDETLRLATRRGLATTGRVWDKISGQPVAGAVIQVLRQQGAREASYDWDHRALRLTTVDRDGRFATAGLQRGSSYRLGVSAPGHESAVLNGAQAGDTNLVARLGPELVVHGRITGDVGPVSQLGVSYTIIDREVNSSSQYAAHYWPTNGGVEFQFTNRMAGLVELAMRGFQQTREVDAPVADWRVELTNSPVRPAAPADSDPPEVRDVVVRLKAASGIPPRGAIDLNVPVDLHSLHLYHTEKAALQNGAVVVKVPVGADIEYAPGQSTLGYWFESGRTNVTAGRGPLLIEVPVIPAGVITARARNADGSPAGDLFFSVKGLKSAPGVKNREANYGGGDTRSDNAPRTYLSPPLPLDGTYEIIGWRGNSFCVSAPTTLTEAAPDAAVELQFSAGQDLTGRVLAPDGQPLRGAEVTEEIDVDGNGFQLNQPAFTDAKGEFRVTGCTPELAHYTLNIAPPGCVAEQVRVDFKRLPLTVKLKAGLKLTGRVVKAATGRGVPNAEVRVVAQGGPWLPGTTRTDADGNFDFNTLGEATYQIYVNGAYFIHRDTVNSGLIKDTQYQQKEFRAGVETNLLLEVTPYPGSQLAE